jgi:hypothetical protein
MAEVAFPEPVFNVTPKPEFYSPLTVIPVNLSLWFHAETEDTVSSTVKDEETGIEVSITATRVKRSLKPETRNPSGRITK